MTGFITVETFMLIVILVVVVMGFLHDDSAGGVIVTALGGKIMCDNTLDT